MLRVALSGESLGVVGTADDVRSIRRDCRTRDAWQSQVLQSLINSGWTLSMLLWVPAADPRHWFEILNAERQARWQAFDPRFENLTEAGNAAARSCGDDRDAWLVLCLRTLEERGWTRTMLSEALGLARTNIIRRLDRAVDDAVGRPELVG